MKKLALFFGLMAMTIFGLNAGPVDQQKAQLLGTRFMGTTAVAQRNSDIQLNLVSAYFDRSGVDYYAFNVRGGGNGFVVVAGDDRVKPILAYSTTGSFNPQDVSEGFSYMLNSYREEIHFIREHNLTATPDIVAEWESVLRTGSLQQGRQARAVVGPLCQTIWNQNFPYNSQCPEDPEGNGGYVYAGCVATAMGQVMKYYDWPPQGTGSYSYNPEGYAQQTANFGETDYHFELMPLALDSTSTAEDYFYIAQFLHHCGISVDMQYSGHGSGAYSQDVVTALHNYFRYTCDNQVTLSFWGFYYYTVDQWIQMLKDGGLDENIPLYYSGSDDNGAGGHAFVCDGYDENNYFHFNWGWSGKDDAWCPIGALNTTKYAFNDSNVFIGHIQPNSDEYSQRADSVLYMQVVENDANNGVTMTWANPEHALNNTALTDITSVTVRRNGEVIATLTNVQPGEVMTYQDENLAPGLYEYAVFVTNSFGISRTVYRKILVGEKCPVTFVLQDDGGDGWKGAAISVTSEAANGQRIAVITMTEGTMDSIVVPLLRGDLNFIWNHGWFHLSEGYDTDYECSFAIYNADGEEIYTSEELEDGIFVTYENNCEYAPLACYPVQNLQGEYQWHNGEEFGAYLTWDQPIETSYLSYFQIVRTVGANKGDEVLAEIPYDGSANYDYFDNTYGVLQEEVSYSVRSVYVRGDEQCESEYMEVLINITAVEDQVGEAVKVYPNPSNGQLHVDGQGVMTVSVYDMLGQEVMRTVAEGQTVVDLKSNGSGVYMVRIETDNQVVIKKVTLNK